MAGLAVKAQQARASQILSQAPAKTLQRPCTRSKIPLSNKLCATSFVGSSLSVSSARRGAVLRQSRTYSNVKMASMMERVPYQAPKWAEYLQPMPTERIHLSRLPTPIHRWSLPGLPEGMEVWIKRDDLTGLQLSGNKVRKLEFLMADAKACGADCVITIGGIQSNHCRATAVAARYCGLDSHLILRTSRTAVDEDPGLIGNLLVERMVGAKVHLVTKEEYVKHGSLKLGELLVERLKNEGRKPYLIPVGGSNSLGVFGYVESIRELQEQLSQGSAGGAIRFDDIFMACGSGGTTAGLALASHLSGLKARVHGYGVCDDPEYFYDYIQDLLDGLSAGVSARDILEMKQAKGQGYAMSTEAELKTVLEVAKATGVVLDPVYTGKAVAAFLDEVAAEPEKWAGRKVLFVHTGGLLGMYEKVSQLQPMIGDWERFKL